MWGQGSDSVGLFPERTPEQDAADLADARAWAQTVFDAGFGWITGPPGTAAGGWAASTSGSTPHVAADYRDPSMSVYGIGLGMVAPTILAHATDEVKEAYLRPMYRGDIVGCQLFSEPSSGSDLASLQTRAVRDGDEWIINGQKVWTSGAQFSDIGEIICRTDPDAPKHRGLTGFVVDMHAPGVEVRPAAPDDRRRLVQRGVLHRCAGARLPSTGRRQRGMDGGADHADERAGRHRGGGGGVGLPSSVRLIEMARATGRSDDPLVRQQLATIIINERLARYTNLRAMARIAVGQLPGPEMSLSKLSLTANMVRTYELVSTLAGPALVADNGTWGTYAWSEFLLGVPGMRVAGGTDEVLHNIIGERVLGLPKDPSPK